MASPSAHNLHIGRRVRERRKLLGLSAEDFAYKIGVSKPQLQKYEAGVNRISAPTLAKCAHILNVEPNFFLQDIRLSDPKMAALHDPGRILDRPETIKLIKNYIAISDTRLRLSLVELICSIRKSNKANKV